MGIYQYLVYESHSNKKKQQKQHNNIKQRTTTTLLLFQIIYQITVHDKSFLVVSLYHRSSMGLFSYLGYTMDLAKAAYEVILYFFYSYVLRVPVCYFKFKSYISITVLTILLRLAIA